MTFYRPIQRNEKKIKLAGKPQQCTPITVALLDLHKLIQSTFKKEKCVYNINVRWPRRLKHKQKKKTQIKKKKTANKKYKTQIKIQYANKKYKTQIKCTKRK